MDPRPSHRVVLANPLEKPILLALSILDRYTLYLRWKHINDVEPRFLVTVLGTGQR